VFTLDQTVDPLRDFFMPFSFPKQSEKLRNAEAAMPRLGTAADNLLRFAGIPKPIFALLIHLAANAFMFSLVAGLTLLVFYLSQALSIPASPMIKILFQVILIADLLLLLLSVTKIVFRTLRDI